MCLSKVIFFFSLSWILSPQFSFFSLTIPPPPLPSQKLMVLMNPKDKEEKEEEPVEEIGRMQTDVTDEDMAQR